MTSVVSACAQTHPDTQTHTHTHTHTHMRAGTHTHTHAHTHTHTHIGVIAGLANLLVHVWTGAAVHTGGMGQDARWQHKCIELRRTPRLDGAVPRGGSTGCPLEAAVAAVGERRKDMGQGHHHPWDMLMHGLHGLSPAVLRTMNWASGAPSLGHFPAAQLGICGCGIGHPIVVHCVFVGTVGAAALPVGW